MKLLRFSLIALISLLFLSPNCLAMEKPTERFYVNDFADILSDETEQFIFDESVKLEDATSAQIVVVTVPNLEGKSLEEYSLELARSYGIGDKEKNNGLLLLLALEERQFRVEVGYGLEGALPDAKTGRIQDKYIIPYLREDKWDEGILNGYKAFYQIVAEEYHYDGAVAPEELESDEIPFSWYLFLLQFFLMFPAAILSNKIVPVKYTKNKKTRKATKNAKLFFIVLEAVTVLVSLSLLSSSGLGAFPAFFTFGFFSLMNYALAFGSASSGGNGSHGSSSSWSSGSSSSGGSSFSGGGGSFGGGGSSRGF